MKKCILIADDEEDICELISQELEFSGYETESALNGEEALKIFNSKEIHGIISDFHMPKVSGIDLLKQVRSQKPDLFFILMLTDPTPSEEIQAKELNATYLMSKPISFELLVELCTKNV